MIGDCCKFAAACSGGMTKLRGRKTTPEAYIRAYRKALENATGLNDAPFPAASILPAGFALPATTRAPPTF